MEIKSYKCGLCKEDKHKKIYAYVGTRKGLRDHLEKSHFIFSHKTNWPTEEMRRQQNPTENTKQNWWITEVFT